MPLPFAEVKRVDAAHVLSRLGVARAREARKHACIACESSDALHAHAGGGMKCFACGQSWSNVDAAMHVRSLNARGACAWLAESFGVASVVTPAPRRAVVAPVGQDDELSALRTEGMIPSTRAQIFAEVSDALTLTARGAEYLRAQVMSATMSA
jgi:hypothetical protein